MGDCEHYKFIAGICIGCNKSQYQILKEQKEALEAQQQWVPVSERQPDTCEFIAFDGEDIFTASSFCADELVSDRYEGVTHWMPLPEPPKEDGSDAG